MVTNPETVSFSLNKIDMLESSDASQMLRDAGVRGGDLIHIVQNVAPGEGSNSVDTSLIVHEKTQSSPLDQPTYHSRVPEVSRGTIPDSSVEMSSNESAPSYSDIVELKLSRLLTVGSV